MGEKLFPMDQLATKTERKPQAPFNTSKSKAPCSLEVNYGESTSGPEHVHVPKWGGVAKLDDEIRIKLINTCPIDNYLTIFYLHYKDHPEVDNQLTQSAPLHPYINYLTQALHKFNKQRICN